VLDDCSIPATTALYAPTPNTRGSELKEASSGSQFTAVAVCILDVEGVQVPGDETVWLSVTLYIMHLYLRNNGQHSDYGVDKGRAVPVRGRNNRRNIPEK
jgi:hypothetical protein